MSGSTVSSWGGTGSPPVVAYTTGPTSSVPSASGPESSSASALPTTLTPADGETLTSSPSSLVISFDQEVDFFWLDGDVMLSRVNNDGSLTSQFSPSNLPMASFDPTGSQATIPLDQPLSPGRYRIVLAGGTDVANLVGSGLWDTSVDQTLGEFTVVQPGVTLAGATNLGTIGPQVQSVAGSLDLSAGQENVALYKFTLAPGHFWRLGLQFDAQRIGSGLSGAIALFDQSGALIASRDAGTGRPDFPADPFLFTGLNPGVYYVGVSGAGNVPGQPGGYDPVAGTIGTSGLSQPGGPFGLDLVADVADTPTRVLGFMLQYNDSLNPSPTGLTIGFSGPIDPSSIVGKGTGQYGVVVVDQAGKSWGLTPVGYSESNCQVTFVFNQPLPAGRYTLRVPATGGLTDLAGKAPTAPGLAPGVLASWVVGAPRFATIPDNLGIVWPSSGLGGYADIGPGQSIVLPVAVPVSGFTKLETILSQGQLAIQRIGADGMVVLEPGTSAPVSDYLLGLLQGFYWLKLTAVGTQTVHVYWGLKPESLNPESLIDNGVGQSPALSLRLLSPSWTDSTPDAPAGPAAIIEPAGPAAVDTPAGSAGPVSSNSPTESAGPVAANVMGPQAGSSSTASPLPSSLLVTVNTGLLGLPSSQSDTVAAVGPTVAGGYVAMADSSSGLLPGLLDRDYRGAVEPDENGPVNVVADRSSSDPAQQPAAGDGPGAVVAGVPVEIDAEAVALARAERIAAIVTRLGRWFTGIRVAEPDGGPGESPASPESAPDGSPTVLAVADPARDAESIADRTERAELGVPTTVVVVVGAAYRLRKLASRWWRRTPGRAPKAPSNPAWSPRGPHAPHRRSEAEATRRGALRN
jgi:hypothetical protein